MRKCVGLRWMTFESESAYKKFIAKKKQVELEKETCETKIGVSPNIR